MPKLKYLSVCSGIEAASVAKPEEWEPIGFSEIDPFPSAVLNHHFPNIKNYGDITEYKQWQLSEGSADLLIGGTPCQSFSVAGLRGGIEDPRGNLALTFLGLADTIKPKYIIWENVPGVLSSNGGRDFGSFIGALAKFGYGFAWRILDAQNFGVPQRRRRLYLCAVRGSGGWRTASEILFERESMLGNTKKIGEKGQNTTTASESGITTELQFFDNQSLGEYAQNNVASTCKARDYKDATDLVVKPIAFKVRGGGNYSGTKGGEIKPNETGGTGYLGCEDKTFTIASVQDQYVAIPFRKSKRAQSETDYESWINANESNTLNVFDQGETRTTHAIVESQFNVRRLTPKETERLQGFPDNWTQIPWRSKPAEFCPDSLRFKAVGNSMAVPVVRWIFNRINQKL
jgi:DNA (cytosine-5)-methyltransferase 1